jgi:hypothetical protein
VTHDQGRRLEGSGVDGVERGACESQKASLLTGGAAQGDRPGPRCDQRPGGRAEKTVGSLEAPGSGNEDPVAFPASGILTRPLDLSRRLIARHQGIAHAGEGGHGSGPEEPLGASAHSGPAHLDQDVLIRGLRQVQTT